MKEHMRFSVVYWHTFRGTGSDPFGHGAAMQHPGMTAPIRSKTPATALAWPWSSPRKLGAPYLRVSRSRHRTRRASQPHRERTRISMSSPRCCKEEQERTGIKLLMGHAKPVQQPPVHARRRHGPQCRGVRLSPPRKSRKNLEVTKELGGENYVFWGGREGYQNLYNTDMKRELDNLGRLLAHGGRLRQGNRLHRSVPHRAQAQGADQAPVRQRCRRLHQLPAGLRLLVDHFKLNMETNHATLGRSRR